MPYCYMGRTNLQYFCRDRVVPFSGIGFTFLDYFLGVVNDRTSNRHIYK
nr:MAG TPA: hypothetical protein [Caudoviricetes sp.]